MSTKTARERLSELLKRQDQDRKNLEIAKTFLDIAEMEREHSLRHYRTLKDAVEVRKEAIKQLQSTAKKERGSENGNENQW